MARLLLFVFDQRPKVNESTKHTNEHEMSLVLLRVIRGSYIVYSIERSGALCFT